MLTAHTVFNRTLSCRHTGSTPTRRIRLSNINTPMGMTFIQTKTKQQLEFTYY